MVTGSILGSPIKVGTMMLKNRVIAPPHAALLGNLFGSEAEAAPYISYWESLARGGTALLTALNGFVENILPPGFDPTGVGARKAGVFRNPLFVERMGRIAEAVHAHGACASTQLIMQGGMPHGPSNTLSGPVINTVPHALTLQEIDWFVREYRFSAEQALAAGLDAIELHANHDDLIEWFLSPLTNRRSDEFGGSFEKRMAFLGAILDAIREGVGDRLNVGVRLNMAEAEPGGYAAEEGLHIAQWIEATGRVDYLHLVMGTGWGYPSYIQSPHFRSGAWSSMAQTFRQGLRLPVVYGGRVDSAEVAERILAADHADLVSVGRAHLADPDFTRKATGEDVRPLRPCIGTNDCINRALAEGLPFGCASNPSLGLGDRGPVARADVSRSVLVIGGGPAGLQLAVTAAERGHEVELWEGTDTLGGQVRLSSLLPGQEIHSRLIEYLSGRLDELSVTVRTGKWAGAASVRAHACDVVAIATGATARWPEIEGVRSPQVCDAWQYLSGEAEPGQAVALVVQEDHIAPLAVADRLGREGRAVTMFVQTNGPAHTLSRYSIGTMLGRLSEARVKIVATEAVTRIALPEITTRNVYSGIETVHGGFDSVVLACGGLPRDALFAELSGDGREIHVLGDAYAPRRISFATQQGYALAKTL